MRGQAQGQSSSKARSIAGLGICKLAWLKVMEWDDN